MTGSVPTIVVDVDTLEFGDVLVRAHGLGERTVASVTWDRRSGTAGPLHRVDFVGGGYQLYAEFDEVTIVDLDVPVEPEPELVRIGGRLYDVDHLIDRYDADCQDRGGR